MSAQSEWNKRNRDKCRESSRKWEAKNIEKRSKARNLWWKTHPEKQREQCEKYKEKRQLSTKLWIIKNKETVLCYTRNRRSLKKNAEGFHTKADILILLKNQGSLCNICSNYLYKYHVDHIIPLSRGGSNWPGNLQILCPHCNTSKGSKLMEEFMKFKKESYNG